MSLHGLPGEERGQVLRKLLSLSQPVESSQPQRVLRWPKGATMDRDRSFESTFPRPAVMFTAR